MKRYRVALVVLGILAWLLVNILLFNWFFQRELDLVEVVVARKTLFPETKIMLQHLTTTKIPARTVSVYVIQDKEKLVGKYIDHESTVHQGSMFHRDAVIDEGELRNYPGRLLKAGQYIFSLPIDRSLQAGALYTVGQEIDLYVMISRRSEPALVDCLYRKVRILAIKDRNGIDVYHDKSNNVPERLLLAVDEKAIVLLSAALNIGNIQAYIPASYSIEGECVLNEESAVLPLITNQR